MTRAKTQPGFFQRFEALLGFWIMTVIIVAIGSLSGMHAIASWVLLSLAIFWTIYILVISRPKS